MTTAWAAETVVGFEEEPMTERRKITDEREARRCLTAAARSGNAPGAWARANGIDGRSLNAWRINLARRGTVGRRRRRRLVRRAGWSGARAGRSSSWCRRRRRRPRRGTRSTWAGSTSRSPRSRPRFMVSARGACAALTVSWRRWSCRGVALMTRRPAAGGHAATARVGDDARWR